jgi:hypothetical protein
MYNFMKHDENGFAVRELMVREEKFQGRWVIVDGELRPAE